MDGDVASWMASAPDYQGRAYQCQVPLCEALTAAVQAVVSASVCPAHQAAYTEASYQRWCVQQQWYDPSLA